jgi:hypothetical protein
MMGLFAEIIFWEEWRGLQEMDDYGETSYTAARGLLI